MDNLKHQLDQLSPYDRTTVLQYFLERDYSLVSHPYCCHKCETYISDNQDDGHYPVDSFECCECKKWVCGNCVIDANADFNIWQCQNC